MTEADLTLVEETVRIHASPETVWRLWTDPDGICAWWGADATLDPRPGGVCRVEMEGGGVMLGRYVELVPHERIVFTFGWEPVEGAPDVPPESTRVEVTLLADAGDTILTLRHTGLSRPAAEEHRNGWAHFLGRLEHAAKPRLA
jgi:uncharacterized protein YndB with AHSA1/START domain